MSSRNTSGQEKTGLDILNGIAFFFILILLIWIASSSFLDKYSSILDFMEYLLVGN